MRIAFLIFDDLTTLDAIGPFEVLCRIPGAEVMFVGETAGIKRADPKSLGIVADYSIADVTSADILLVPGGRGEAQVREKPHMLEWVRKIDATTRWTTSVCTGASGARCGRLAEGTARDDALGEAREVARVRRRAALSARRRGRQNYHRRRSFRRYRHGAASGAPSRGRHHRARDPGWHRVRSAAAVRRKRRPRAGARHGSFAATVSEIGGEDRREVSVEVRTIRRQHPVCRRGRDRSTAGLRRLGDIARALRRISQAHARGDPPPAARGPSHRAPGLRVSASSNDE